MKQSEALTGARGQIAWILALVLSTSAIIYLERLDMGTPSIGASDRTAAGPTALSDRAAAALGAAEKRHADAPDGTSAAALALALVAAVQAGALDLAEGRARLAPVRAEVALAPNGAGVAVLADLTFGD